MDIAHNTIERLFLYRRIAQGMTQEGKRSFFSHELGSIAGASSEQVRRDLMLLGAEGHRRTGYDVERLLQHLDSFFCTETVTRMVLVGIGNLGRAALSYFSGKRANLTITAAFDTDPAKTGRIIHGCRCYGVDEISAVMQAQEVHVGIITVPADAAQEIAERLVKAGVKAILNMAPVRLRVPEHIFIEDLDLTLSIEKLAFLAKSSSNKETDK